MSPGKHPYILLVEDERIVAKDQAGRLERQGYRVAVAGSGRKAVEIALEEPIDLVLMDIKLGGGLNGIDAAEEILRQKELPVVFLTAYADPKTLEDVSRVTRYGYVLKNSGMHLLLQAIKMALDLFWSRQEIQEREERLRGLINASPDIVLLIDAHGRLVEANRNGLELLGLQGCRWRGRFAGDLEREMNPALVEPFRELTNKRREHEVSRWDARVIDASAVERVFDVIQATWTVGDGERGLIVIARDVSERSRATENLRQKTQQLQRLSRHMQDAREEQNRYIAREIHDELGQALTSMDILLTLAEEEQETERLNKTLKEIREVLQNTSSTVGNLVRVLRPSVLDHLGLVEALRVELEEFEKRSGVPCDFHNTLGNEPAVGEKCELAIYRVLQEALTNVARHADASNVELQLSEDEGSLILRVRDDGRGFQPSTPGGEETFGLLGMEERAHACGGSLTVESTPGAGTEVTVRIPQESGQ
jgi:PAS domain S-box-containing protein